jgi:hypothetical protein
MLKVESRNGNIFLTVSAGTEILEMYNSWKCMKMHEMYNSAANNVYIYPVYIIDFYDSCIGYK